MSAQNDKDIQSLSEVVNEVVSLIDIMDSELREKIDNYDEGGVIVEQFSKIRELLFWMNFCK
ncbi:hypothetical protein MKY96_32540 [Paenibacillus sp. FSL R7-0302]|uniref:hypothetical protein n=1 Tax=Paenibacillus sp. FSL R7-0302 TaxID=2921681 RepID=UPI0030F8F27D